MQALEGEETPVRTLYDLVCADPRHHHITTLLAAPVAARLFPEWSMGFRNVDGTEIGSTAGYNPNPLFPAFDHERPWKASVAMRLLAGFVHTG